MSLTTCIKKAGTALREEDKAAILASSRQYRAEGLTPDQAGIRAIEKQIAAVNELIEKEQKTKAAVAPNRGQVAFTRRGDFWYLSGDQARVVARTLESTLTTARDGQMQVAVPDYLREQATETLKAAGFSVQFDQATDEGLTAPTKADVLGQQQRAADGEKALAQSAKDAEQRAKADAQRSEFTLTGSDRAADVGAAGGQETMFSRANDTSSPEQNALQALSQTDELFALPKSDKMTVEDITADVAPNIKVKKMNYPGLVTTYALTMPDGGKATVMVRKVNPYGESQAYGLMDREDGEFEAITDRPGFKPENIPEGTEDVYIDVSNLKEGGQGGLIYNIAATFAHNTNRVLIGDPDGLSNVAMRRRTEHMLSSALKFGTTRHLAPHPRQTEGAVGIGVPALRWTYGDDLGNIKSLIETSTKSLKNAGGNPFTYSPTDGTFRNAEGDVVDESGISLAATLGSGKPGKAGRATLQRSAVLSALLREQGEEGGGSGRRVGLLGALLEWGREHSVALKGVFYASGLKQPGVKTASTASLRAAVTSLIGGDSLPNQLGKVVVATSVEIKSTWEPLIGKRGMLDSKDPAQDALGFFDPKTQTIFLMPDRIRAGDESAVLAHELMHKHGKAVLGQAGWDRLHTVIKGWANAESGSDERAVYNYAATRVGAVGESLSSEELFPYAVEAALKMGIKPSMAAKRGTVAYWLESVRQNLQAVWGKVTGKPGTFKVQDLADLAFAVAQMENPDSKVAMANALRGGGPMFSRAETPAAVDKPDGVAPTYDSAAGAQFAAADQTKTEAFKKWFSDSKVVDSEGKPLVVYHGTDVDVAEFSKAGATPLGFRDKQGFYFTTDPGYAEDYGGTLMPVYLAIKNPYRAPADGYEHTYISPTRRSELENLGHDGVIFPGSEDGYRPSEIIAFNPEQIKSAIGNNGNFDSGNPNIAFARGAAYTDKNANVNEPTQQDGGKAPGAQPAADDAVRGSGTPVQRRASIVGLGIAENIQRAGSTALVGRKVSSPAELAELAQVYRDPQYETFRVFLTKGDTITHSTGVSSRLPGQTPMIPAGTSQAEYFSLFKSEMARTGADGYYILHNHPSGNPTPSRADLNLTAVLAQRVPGMKAHVVINSNKFAVITPGGNGAVEQSVVTRDFGPDMLLKSSKPMAVIGRVLTSPDVLVSLGKSLQQPGWVTLIGTGSDGAVRMVAEAPSNTLTRSNLYLSGMVRRLQRQSGSVSMFAIGSDADIASKAVRQAVRSGILQDAVPENGPSLQSQGVGFGASSPFGQTNGRLVARATSAPAYTVNKQQSNLFQPTIWNAPDPTRTDRLIYELQDGKVDLKRVQEAIAKSGQKIEEQFDARLAETLYPGRVAYRSQAFLDTEVKALLTALTRSKVAMADLSDYLHARGAEERNVQIAKVNPAMPDGGAGTNSQGLLLTTQAARTYLSNVPAAQKVVLDKLAAQVDAITAGTRALLVSEGLEEQSTINAWTAAYKNYVPMYRDEAESGTPTHSTGSGFTVRGNASKRATGSTKEVTNILAHVLMQREAAITRAEKNRVALALYGQALSHPNPDFWTTIKPSMSAAQIGAELQAMGVDPLTAQVGMEGVPTIRTVDPATGKVIDRPNPMYRNLPGAIPLKVNGKDRVLMLNVTSERGQRLAESLKNLDGLTKLDLANGILSKFFPTVFSPKIGIGGATRWLASVNTQYNPAFGLVNVTRDVLGGVINLGSTELRGNALKVLAKTPVAILGIARELASGGQTGKWQTLYRQFQADGGQTGFKDNFRDANDRARAVEKEIASLQRAGKFSGGRAAHAMLDLLDGFNTTLENAVRLSAYSAALDKGISRANAARLGRELTVDFNRKGRLGRELGPLYAFFNASVQGSARTIETLKGPTGRRVIMGGLGLGVAQALMLLAAGYDDDEIPEFVKTRALIIPLFDKDKNYISVPYPLGLHVIPNTGRVLAELTLNGGQDIGKRSVAAIGELAGAFNPLGGGNIFTADGALKTVTPTVFDPLIEIGFNQNFAGNKIEKEAYGGERDNRPGVNRTKEATMRSTTGQAYMGISKAMNSLTGGTDYEAGAISWTPERVRYLAQTVGGGVLREIEKTINASTAAARGEPVKRSQIPVLGRFSGEVDADQVQTSRYFKKATELDKLESSLKAAISAGGAEAAQKLYEENLDVALVATQNKVQASLSKLNKLAVTIVKNQDDVKAVDEARVQTMSAFNEAVKELEAQTGKQTLGDKFKKAVGAAPREAVTP